MQCLNSSCQPFEFRQENMANFDGMLTFYEVNQEGVLCEVCSCSAFMVYRITKNAQRGRTLDVDFVPIENLAKAETDASARVDIPIAEIYSDPSAVVSRLGRAGFYISPEASPEFVVSQIHSAMDQYVLSERTREDRTACNGAAKANCEPE